MNEVIISGNLTKDPLIKSTKSGRAMAMFTVACNKNVASESGEIRQVANFVNCMAYGKLAEVAADRLEKGKRVVLIGEYESWSRKGMNGNVEYGNNVRVMDMGVSFYGLSNRSVGTGNMGTQSGSYDSSQDMPPTGFEQFAGG